MFIRLPEHLKVDLNVHLHLHDERARSTVRYVYRKLTDILENFMAIDLAALTADVNDIDNVDDAVVALIQRLADEVASLPATQSAIDDLAARLRTSADALAAAVTANTPTPPAPPAPPAP